MLRVIHTRGDYEAIHEVVCCYAKMEGRNSGVPCEPGLPGYLHSAIDDGHDLLFVVSSSAVGHGVVVMLVLVAHMSLPPIGVCGTPQSIVAGKGVPELAVDLVG